MVYILVHTVFSDEIKLGIKLLTVSLDRISQLHTTGTNVTDFKNTEFELLIKT